MDDQQSSYQDLMINEDFQLDSAADPYHHKLSKKLDSKKTTKTKVDKVNRLAKL